MRNNKDEIIFTPKVSSNEFKKIITISPNIDAYFQFKN